MFVAPFMQAEIQTAIDSAKLTHAAAGALARLTPGTYVTHKSWGFGQVAALDFLVHQMTIDFRGKKGHAMQLQYAAESLVVVPAEHILAQKAAISRAQKRRSKPSPRGSRAPSSAASAARPRRIRSPASSSPT